MRGKAAHETRPAGDDRERARSDRRMFDRLRDERDPLGRDAVVERFLPLARQLAARYQRPGEPFDDVFQVACYGLVKAVDRFDADRGVAFSSYAVPTITGEIKRHFRDRAWAVRVPRDLQELALRVERIVAERTRDLGRAPTVEEVAGTLGITEEEVLEGLDAAGAYRATSLDTPLASHDDDAGGTLGDVIGVVDQGFLRAEQRVEIGAMMRSLTRTERAVVRLRFEQDLTQSEIGGRLGISQMQVSRVLRRSITKLRTVADVAPDAVEAA